MEEFEIKGDNGFVRLKIEKELTYHETSRIVECDLVCSVLVKSIKYEVKTEIWIQPSDILNFYQQILKCQKELKGEANFDIREHVLQVELIYGELGHCMIQGSITEYNDSNEYKLIFELGSDQSYISDTLRQMKPIVDKYGDRTGMTR